ncbi:unnamed protein product [Schistosoma rodhaini]|uniref:Transmembrane protein 231 n=1 Tax=Schistosoma rodhaini TaxID=6188 RepID=A0AA85GJP8_9TREM|nr:unnamed protein product [Schistosoma rodhaini]CAH8659079.1 unnamed protein product [Schistosoma rodhaini]
MKVYKLCELRRYYAGVSSLAFAFDTFVVLIITLVPWIISYITGFMYETSYTFPEKPLVSFDGNMLLFLQKSDGLLYYGSIPHQETNHLLQSSLRLPQISFYNSKNRNLHEEEAINIYIKFPMSPSEKIISLTVVLFVDVTSLRFYNRQDKVPMFISKVFRSPTNGFLYSGDFLCFRKYSFAKTSTYYETKTIPRKIFELSSNISRSGYYLLEDRISVPIIRESLSSTFDIELSVYFSSLRISTNPGFWYTIKFAWVQYLSIGLVIFYLAEKMRGYIYDKQIVRTIVHSTIPKSLD